MIYILSGNDTKKKNAYLKKLYKGNVPLFVPLQDFTKEILFEQAGSVSLFGESPFVVIDGIIKEGNIEFSSKDLSILSDSLTNFVFIENKLLALGIKKYKNYATVEDFSTTILKQTPKTNIFGIVDALSKRDKIGTWILYMEAINSGSSPEEISGIIFWKLKTMILSGTKIFSKDELRSMSSELVSIYHKAHKGECDFIISLEQFILTSLSK